MMDVRAAFPLTLRHIAPALGGDVPDADTREAFVRAVCDRFPRGDIPHRAARDLVRYEGYLDELPPAPRADASDAPADDAPCRLADHARLHVYGADLPGVLRDLREGRPARPRPARGWVLLFRGADGAARERWLAGEEGWLVESFRAPTSPQDAVEDDEDRALFEELWRAGVLARA